MKYLFLKKKLFSTSFLECLTRNSFAVGIFLYGGSDLTKIVVGVFPLRTIGEGAVDPLIAVIVGIIIGPVDRAGGVIDRRQAIIGVILPRCRQNGTGGIGNHGRRQPIAARIAGIGCRQRAVAHRCQPRLIVVGIAMVEYRRTAVIELHPRPSPQCVVSYGLAFFNFSGNSEGNIFSGGLNSGKLLFLSMLFISSLLSLCL